jgi:hypothetical protein
LERRISIKRNQTKKEEGRGEKKGREERGGRK